MRTKIIVICAVAMIVPVVATVTLIDALNKGNWPQIKAQTVGYHIEKVEGKNQGGRYNYVPNVAYEVEGETYQTGLPYCGFGGCIDTNESGEMNIAKTEKMPKVLVHYNPDDPSQLEAPNMSRFAWPITLFFIWGGVVAVLTPLTIIDRRRQKKMGIHLSEKRKRPESESDGPFV